MKKENFIEYSIYKCMYLYRDTQTDRQTDGELQEDTPLYIKSPSITLMKF